MTLVSSLLFLSLVDWAQSTQVSVNAHSAEIESITQSHVAVPLVQKSPSVTIQPTNTCAALDTELAEFTVLRYLVLALIIAYRVQAHMPKEDLSLSNCPSRFFWAGIAFASQEGIGLVVYFVVSAIMDNFTIFIYHSDDNFCAYVKMVAIYSMALLTFLPNCLVAYTLQKRMFEQGTTMQKVQFLFLMLTCTVAFFFLRICVVYQLGYAGLIEKMMNGFYDQGKIALAIITPPVVDGLQSVLLIAASHFASKYGTEVEKPASARV